MSNIEERLDAQLRQRRLNIARINSAKVMEMVKLAIENNKVSLPQSYFVNKDANKVSDSDNTKKKNKTYMTIPDIYHVDAYDKQN